MKPKPSDLTFHWRCFFGFHNIDIQTMWGEGIFFGKPCLYTRTFCKRCGWLIDDWTGTESIKFPTIEVRDEAV